jgi:ABC-type uncharacterized transport system auxiliary subunit
MKAGRSSFLTKRSKKLLHIAPGPEPTRVGSVPHETDKSFLVLFFKKEHLPFLSSRRAIIVAAATLGACSVLPARPYQQRREWPLAVLRPGALPARAGGEVLLVRDTQAAPGLDSRGLRTKLPDGAERLDYWEEWAVPPSQGVGTCLLQWLMTSGRFAAVVPPGSDAPADLILESELLALVGDQAAGRASASLSLVLLRRAARGGRDTPLLQRTVTGTAPLTGMDGPALAAALQAAVADLLRQTEAVLAPYAAF